MFIVLLSAIIVFSIIDTFIMQFTGDINLFLRLAFHLPLIPLVAGISYELIKISSRNNNLFSEHLENLAFGYKTLLQGNPMMKW